MRTRLSVFCEKIIEAGWLAAAVAVPLFFNIYTARTFEPDKITLLRAIAGLMILAWLIMVVEQGFSLGSNESALGNRLREWVKRPLTLPTLLLVIVYIISTIFSISPNVSWWGSYQRLQGTYSMLSYITIFALMAATLRTREQVDRLVTTIIITSVPVGLYGIVQRYGLDPLPWAGNVTARVAANMGNPIFVASYLIMITPLTISRLVESMAAIIKDKDSSWGHTILAAIYIFALAVQILTVLFSGSRGPLLGVLGAAFIMGLLFILALRQLNADTSGLSLKEIGQGILFAVPLGLAGGALGGLGLAIGWGIESLLAGLGYEASNILLLGGALGGALGFLGLYAYMAAAQQGGRWLWLSWVSAAALAILFVLALNIRGAGFDAYLNPIRELPYVGRLGEITGTDSGTGKVRVLIWDAALELIMPHEPLGVEADPLTPKDSFNFLRPLVGYGPESMFNAFAYVYPPDLAHVEARGSSADRSHNETVDSLVITGILGFLAFYYLMISLFYYVLVWLGWAPTASDRLRLIALLIVGGLVGAVVPYLADGSFTFMPLGLPFGLVAGAVIHLCWQGLISRPTAADDNGASTSGSYSEHNLLLIGVLGAIVGHFIEVHFVFSIAATYTYFWIYLGLMVALSKIMQTEQATELEAPVPEIAQEEAPPAPVATRRGKKRRGRRVNPMHSTATRAGLFFGRESWETWVGSQGLVMAIILVIATFDFITPQFELNSENGRVFFWMTIITWLVGFAVTLSTAVIRSAAWQGQFNWVRAVVLYSVTSLSYFFFYATAHSIQFGRRMGVQSAVDAVRAADILSGGLVIFYIFLLLLLAIIALTLSWGRARGLAFWRAENWWLYPPLALAVVAVIWFKNIDVARADIYLKEGERYRNNQQWDYAVALHEKARSLDSDEDFYYLMLALDYQLMAQDPNLEQSRRQFAWQQGEQIALEARRVNPYNPDNTGNMGRYYFTLGQIFTPERFQDALSFFERATQLAPSNVIYHNLWAQTHYILQNYDAAIDRLQTSVAIDPNYAPTWLLLGDTYAAKGDVDKALMAHSQALKLNSLGSGNGFAGFADQFVDQRLNFYVSAGRVDDLIAVLQQLIEERPEEARLRWVIGHIYNLQNRHENAVPYLQQAIELGDNSDRTTRELANSYLALNNLEQAVPAYRQLLQANPNDIESHSALAFVYAQLGRLDEAIQHNLAVVQQLPQDYDSLKNLALLYQQNGQLQQALDYAQQAQAVAPEGEQSSWEQFIANIESQLTTNN